MGETKPRVFVMTGNGIEGCHDHILRETHIPRSEEDTDGTDDVYLAPISTIFSRKRSHSKIPSPKILRGGPLMKGSSCHDLPSVGDQVPWPRRHERELQFPPHESQHGNQWKQWLAERFVCRVVVSQPEDMRLLVCSPFILDT